VTRIPFLVINSLDVYFGSLPCCRRHIFFEQHIKLKTSLFSVQTSGMFLICQIPLFLMGVFWRINKYSLLICVSCTTLTRVAVLKQRRFDAHVVPQLGTCLSPELSCLSPEPSHSVQNSVVSVQNPDTSSCLSPELRQVPN